MKESTRIIELDGRTGEGGGQLVRIACVLAAVATQPIRITNVRGNRAGPRGGGLKAQHVSSIEWLAKATGADVEGLFVGSHTLEFRPRRKPSGLRDRTIKIIAESPAASIMLIFQAIFPFLLFASSNGSDDGKSPSCPVDLEIMGGTNVSFSLSYEYLDQVLLPTIEEAFPAIRVERELKSRGWHQGKSRHGTVAFKIYPLPIGEPLVPRSAATSGGSYHYHRHESNKNKSNGVHKVDVSLIAPATMHSPLSKALAQDLDDLFPNVDVTFKIMEDSGSDSRVYVLLVAISPKCSPETGCTQPRRRWGRDILTAVPKNKHAKNNKNRKKNNNNNNDQNQETTFSENISRKLSRDLYEEISTGGDVDEYLHDQLVIFQALASGRTSFPRSTASDGTSSNQHHGKDEEVSRKKLQEPFGEGSTHTTTARWVTTELLPGVVWYNDGRVCDGVGMRMDKTHT
ncbi:RNA 3'-terminal phosphate cyclase/enolpyruvate transferase [Apodospora peruviana]|uniref:RNA 3'-terminal phosphate cyclase/enolpyruvate transferase n=1 Tax=Apodospora peruviana TaxID=516989 RepID=A0AAE0MFF4_9PEZI|nr:RNA 3'-terminal phosphate cyclase/enolpyruvate transferase [Apodospora peruviana]